jgi:hypothetical protein
MSAATLVGMRIIRGIPPEVMAERMGYLSRAPKSGRARRKAISAAIAQLERTEREMGDARVSTYQRYARAVELVYLPRFPTKRRYPSPRVLARHIKRTRRREAAEVVQHLLRTLPTQR